MPSPGFLSSDNPPSLSPWIPESGPALIMRRYAPPFSAPQPAEGVPRGGGVQGVGPELPALSRSALLCQ